MSATENTAIASESAVAADNTVTVTENMVTVPEVSPQKRFLTHVRKYPLVNSTRDVVFRVPGTRQVATSITPTLKAIRATQPVKWVMDTGDDIAVLMLTQLDSVFPILSTLEAHDLTDPITRPVNGTVKTTQETLNAAHESLFKTIVEPTAKNVSGLRYSFNTLVYDNNGKGIITSQVDPIVAPVNESIEKLITVWFPETEKVSKDHSSELARTLLMLNNVLTQKHAEAPTSTEGASAANETSV